MLVTDKIYSLRCCYQCIGSDGFRYIVPNINIHLAK